MHHNEGTGQYATNIIRGAYKHSTAYDHNLTTISVSLYTNRITQQLL